MSQGPPSEQIAIAGQVLSVKRLSDGSLVVTSGKSEVLAVPGTSGEFDFFEPNHESYQLGDRVALGRGWRPLEMATRSQYELTRAVLRAFVARQSRDTVP